MANDDETEKTHEPTAKKLEDARKKGEIPRSNDLSAAAGYGGLLLAAVAAGATSLTALGDSLMMMIDQADELSAQMFAGAATPLAGGLMARMIGAVSPWFAIPAVAVIVTLLAQRGFTVAPSKLKPKLSRISLFSNAKNKFGRGGLFEFAKSFSKLLIYSLCLGVFLRANLPDMAGTVMMNPMIAVSILARLVVEFLFVVLLVALCIGAIDLMWQRAEHIRKNRMSDKEVRDEHKEAEGDPHLKQKRRQRAQEIAMNQMMGEVPGADVVIVNPTHYAVALKWSRAPGEAPMCVAKGVDEIAARIRQLAQENAVPIHSDPPTARALFATTEIGDEIAQEHYRTVAAAIRFAEKMRKLAGRRV